jgi:hypothetical protein
MSKKHCKGCDEDKDIEDFNWKDKAEGIRQSSCRLCNAKYGREHYKHNKQAYIKKYFLLFCLNIPVLTVVKPTYAVLSLIMCEGTKLPV